MLRCNFLYQLFNIFRCFNYVICTGFFKRLGIKAARYAYHLTACRFACFNACNGILNNEAVFGADAHRFCRFDINFGVGLFVGNVTARDNRTGYG